MHSTAHPWLALGAAVIAVAPLAACSAPWHYDHEAARTVERSAPMAGSMTLTNDVGDILITGDPGATGFSATVELVGKGTTPERAAEALAELDALLTVEGDALTARLDHPEPANGKRYGARWNIVVPAGCDIELTNDVGDVVILGMESDLSVRIDVGDLHAYTAGDLTARTDVGDVTALAAGAADIRVDVGGVTLHRLGTEEHATTVRTDVGSIQVTTLRVWEGDMSLATDVGDVTLRDGQGGQAGTTESDEFSRVDNAGGRPMIRLRADVGGVELRLREDDASPPEAPAPDVPERAAE